MDLHLKGKTAIVTGGSAGIGLAMARLLRPRTVPPGDHSRTVTPLKAG